MFAACCSLLGRSLFVTGRAFQTTWLVRLSPVAAPLVLVGSILFQARLGGASTWFAEVSVELEVQSEGPRAVFDAHRGLQNLRYAVAESGLAAGAEEEVG